MKEKKTLLPSSGSGHKSSCFESSVFFNMRLTELNNTERKHISELHWLVLLFFTVIFLYGIHFLV